ncbi:tRNA (adenine22-N1)-methyltransferase [Oikeobacillus pervagus]|uniref:tRNA (Adenine22-N1)-methyltransferase n=1 Tax=Oikeobacillus pervagus TaxID=1325931 RepID=A0AAJ1WFG0_9BACI|nr:tRNA (adenine(22)-N(1))-methyltransferase TrmK [Oikeobacillus pervagus]MDQ0213902.1 tRNA (adenine22-N1)-methyltransferase [Oikeobacillus pervagus]
MNKDQLSKRLQCVVSYIPKGYSLADIGSDHAYLPCYAVLSGISSKTIAGEVVEGPYQSAKQQVMNAELMDRIDVRKGDGLEVISKGEVDCITIAGMGGTLISSILEKGKKKLEGVKRLILQPNVQAINVRKWLLDNNWRLIEEEIVEENEKIYEILVAEKGDPMQPYNQLELELLVGPFLLKRMGSSFIRKWKWEKEQWEKILTNLEKTEQTKEIMQKQRELQQKIQMIEGVL